MATSLTGPLQVIGADVLSSKADAAHTLGAYAETPDGRGFRYFLNGAVATVAGLVYQGKALDATNDQPSGGHAVAVAAIGSLTVTTTVTLTATKDEFAGGFLSVVVTPGQGYTYKIKGNTAASAGVCTFTLEDPIVVGLTTSSRIIVAQNPYAGCIVAPATPTAAIVGVAPCIVAAGQYGWLQVTGPCAVLFTGTGAAGKAVGILSGGTIGSAAPAIAATNILGYQMATGITAEYALINLSIG